MTAQPSARSARPRLSVVLCMYDMAREIPRTLRSATPPYQRDLVEDDVEVILVDNGSPEPLPDNVRKDLPECVRLVDAPDPQPSPVLAMNWAARELAQGDIVLFAIDGARIFTDGLYAACLAAHDLVDDAFVYTLAWHLGPDVQMTSTQHGYDQQVEDALIEASGWPDDPDGLYSVSVFAGSSRRGYFQPISESNAFSVPRALLDRMGGYDERYTSPGGGFCNLEMFQRYVERPGGRNVCLLSEGTFHQVHGGVATSRTRSAEALRREHVEVTGSGIRPPRYQPLLFGRVRPAANRFLMESTLTAAANGADRRTPD